MTTFKSHLQLRQELLQELLMKRPVLANNEQVVCSSLKEKNDFEAKIAARAAKRPRK